MKDFAWKIKVSDLLKNPWDTDTVKFKEKYLKDENTWEISGEIFLQGLNHNEILVKIKNIKFKVFYKCDKCLKKYSENYEIKNEEDIRFINTNEEDLKEEIFDTTFPIDMKNQTINLEPLINTIVKNQEPIIKDCWNHKNKEEIENEIFQEENIPSTISLWELLKTKKDC